MYDLYSNINVLLHKTLNGIYYTIGYEVTAEHCYQDFLVRSRHCINLCYVLDVQLGSFRAQASLPATFERSWLLLFGGATDTSCS